MSSSVLLRMSVRALVVATTVSVGVAGLPVLGAAGAAVPSATSAGAEVQERPDSVSAMVSARVLDHRVEDLSQRSETAQVFANPDGSWTSEQAPTPVRVQDQKSGRWSDIDTTLVAVEGGFAPRHALGELVVSDGGDATFAAMEIEGHALAWRWPGGTGLPKPVVEGNTATYADVVDGGDLVVTATASGFSHDIVLRKAPADPVAFSIPVTTGGPAVVEDARSGELAVTTKAGDDLVTAPAPLMYDARTDTAGRADHVVSVDTTVTAAPGGAVVTLRPDQGFLTDPATVYPVTVDPSYVSYPTADTWVGSSSPTAIHPYDEELIVGTSNSGGAKYRSLLQFENGSGHWLDTHVTSAYLSMRNFETLDCGPAGNIYVQR